MSKLSRQAARTVYINIMQYAQHVVDAIADDHDEADRARHIAITNGIEELRSDIAQTIQNDQPPGAPE